MRILLVVNSFASSVTARNTVVVHRRLSRGHDVEIVETNRRGHATRFAFDAARRGVDIVVGFGGDGTLNEVATGIAGTDTALGVLPGGSTNVFARTIGLPNDPVAAVDRLAAGIDAGDLRSIGLGRVNGRFFCFHTGVGFDAAVVAAVERHASLKRWLGHPLFISAALSTWARGYDRSEPHFRVVTNDRVIEDGYFSIVLNTNPYTYLGNRPLDLSPAATLDRGLVVITFRTMAARAIISSLFGALRGGGVKPAPHLDEQIDLEQLVIEGARPFPYQLDGDHLGDVTRLEFRHVPDAVRLVFPASGDEAPTAAEVSTRFTASPLPPAQAVGAGAPPVERPVGAPVPTIGLPQSLIDEATADLAAQLGIEPAAISVVEARAVTWPDSSLGCPQPGMGYLQRLTDGVLVVLEAGGRRHEYHGGGSRALFRCADPRRPVGD